MYQEPFAEPHGDLILQVVGLPAGFYIGGSSLLLEPFRLAIEDLKYWSSGSLERIGPASQRLCPGKGARADSSYCRLHLEISEFLHCVLRRERGQLN